MSNLIISAGRKTDIDALACAIAYKNVLTILGRKSFVIISEEFGGTVPSTLFSWGFELDTLTINKDDVFIIVDLSEPKHIDHRVNLHNIIELRDHHPGYEEYRHDRLGKKARIEHIGACATLIFEEAMRHNILEQLESYSINLLLTAILSNTLNFKAQITHERDRDAYQRLRALSTLPQNWSEIYFRDVEKDMLANPQKSLINDTKVMQLVGTNITVAQIELRDSDNFMLQNKDLMVESKIYLGHNSLAI